MRGIQSLGIAVSSNSFRERFSGVYAKGSSVIIFVDKMAEQVKYYHMLVDEIKKTLPPIGYQMRLSNLIVLNSKINDFGHKVAQDLEASYRQEKGPAPSPPKAIPGMEPIPMPVIMKHFICRLRELHRRIHEESITMFKVEEIWLVLNDLVQWMMKNQLQGMAAFPRAMDMLDAYHLKNFKEINLEQIANLLEVGYGAKPPNP
jgi:hypothetical protein